MNCDVIIINFYCVGVVSIIASLSILRTYSQGLVFWVLCLVRRERYKQNGSTEF